MIDIEEAEEKAAHVLPEFPEVVKHIWYDSMKDVNWKLLYKIWFFLSASDSWIEKIKPPRDQIRADYDEVIRFF